MRNGVIKGLVRTVVLGIRSFVWPGLQDNVRSMWLRVKLAE